ncbi:hypothetical protein WJS89_10625 [Sphingomicrobium sp. XHP0235]|uniref:hypothetical protein n=1 Tax=Sphingomicrobium aquimarinum TaxID=3133971 RepID=UPI0031FF14CE
MQTIMPVLQATPTLAFLLVAWCYRGALVRAIRGKHQVYDILVLPIFFVALDIAYNVGVFVLKTGVSTPQTPFEAILRLTGIAFHLVIAWAMIRAKRALDEAAK